MASESQSRGHLSPPDSINGEQIYGHANPSRPISIDPYNTPPMLATQTYNYADPERYELQNDQPYYDDSDYYPEVMYRTPPGPVRSGGIQTRSGRSLATPRESSSPSSRVSPSPRPKRNRKGKEKAHNYQIDQPLSVMTENYDVPVEDMEAWANRPAADRWTEVSGRAKGKIPRPMNSFMLYRRAFKERIKKWGAQGDNNQLISTVAGISWNMEPPAIKDQYTALANTEKDNHAKAFPDYKFTPNKNIKKRDRDDEEDSDPEWEGQSVYGEKRRRGRHDRDVTRSRSPTPGQLVWGSPRAHPSSYQVSNPHMMAGPVYEHWAQPMTYAQYPQYEQMGFLQDGQHTQHTRPVAYAPTSCPMPEYQMHEEQYMSQLVGLPPPTDNIMGGEIMPRPDYAIDPELGEFVPSNSYQYGSFGEDGQDLGPMHPSYPGEVLMHPGMQTLAPAESSWAATSNVGDAFDAELGRWSGDL